MEIIIPKFKAVFRKGGVRVHMVKNEKGHYFFAGGGLRKDKTLEAYVKRECLEEIDMIINIKSV